MISSWIRRHAQMLRAIGLCGSLGASSARVDAQAADAGAAEPADASAPFVEEPVVGAEVVAPTVDAPLEDTPIEVTVAGKRSKTQELQQSAQAVTVVSTRTAKQQTADLGEVLARTQGVNVRRQGGLGSEARISLNGLQSDQIRYYVDGIPLDLAGYPFGLANLPVNLIDRIEIYRGVVPIRFGADALGGAINVVTDQTYETHVGASYQLGSYGVLRSTVAGRYRDEPTGLIAGGALYVDVAENDYMIDGQPVQDEDGNTVYRSVRRFNDGYFAYGGNLELGIVDQKWARKLTVQGFYGTSDKQLQHNAVMSVPFGEVRYGEDTYGATARYEVDLSPEVELELLVNYSYEHYNFEDQSLYRYRWNGERARAIGRDIAPGVPARGELTGKAIDVSFYQDAVFARAGLDWTIAPGHVARLAITPQLTWRAAKDHEAIRFDELDADASIQQVIAGSEYELNLLDDALQNIAFGKLYYLRAWTEYRSLLGDNAITRALSRDMTHLGVGDALRYRFTDWIMAKLSYEYATRLPRPDELFGNGALIHSNLEIEPERSHNVNLGPRLELRRQSWGELTVDVNGFLRDTSNLIVLLAGVQGAPYENILDVRSYGIEGGASWDSPKRYVGLDGSITYQDIRNTSDTGQYAGTEGRRLPARPWLFGSFGVRGRAPGLLHPRDALEPFYHSRYVHGFDRGWALGDSALKLDMPHQWSHNIGITYSLAHSMGNVAATLELDNLTDEALFDVYGVQRPGRSFSCKISGEI